jgi:hypothetical protein
MAKKNAALPKDAPNRRTSHVGSVKSRVNKSSRTNGTLDIAGPLAPQGNKRVSKDFSESPPPPKGVRPDGLDDDLLNRKGDGYTGPRARVHRTPGIEAVPMDNTSVEQVAQRDVPGDLDIP